MIKQVLILNLLVFIFSGCYCSLKKPEPEVVVKTEYVKEPKYEFYKVNTDGLYVDAKAKEVQRMCTPVVLETSDMYRKIVDYYDWQIDEYGKGKENERLEDKTKQ